VRFEPQVSRRGRGYFAEIALARGPRVMAVTGGGTFEELFGYAWLALLDRRERRLRLFQAQAGGAPWAIGGDPGAAEWVEIPIPDLVHPVEEVRHLALAFDQAARHVVAYEHEGEVWVRQWDPVGRQYVMRGPWPGVDPVLVMDATVGNHVPDSDVLLFHLTPDRKTLVMRVQRELYETVHTVETFAEEAILDQGVVLPYQFELLGSLASDPDGTGLVLRSDLYPVRAEDDLGTASLAAPTSGIYWPVVVVRDLGADSLGVANLSAPAAGTYLPLVAVEDLGTDALGTAGLAAPASGVYYPVVVAQGLGTDGLGTAQLAAPDAGTYALVIVVVNLTQSPYGVDSLGTAQLGAPSGGSYVDA